MGIIENWKNRLPATSQARREELNVIKEEIANYTIIYESAFPDPKERQQQMDDSPVLRTLDVRRRQLSASLIKKKQPKDCL